MDNLIYYYCKADTFKKIIQSKELWLTKVMESNDKEEVVRTVKNIWSRVKNKLLIIDGSLGEILNQITQILNINIRNDINEPYAVCFTENDDLVQNWCEYGDRGKGVALGFSRDIFEGIQNDYPFPNDTADMSVGWQKIYYDNGGNKDFDEQLTLRCLDILKANQDFLGPLSVYKTLKSYSAFIKNYTFKDEREIRIVCYVGAIGKNNLQSSVIKFNETSSPPHCSIFWVKENRCALKRVIIGANNKSTKQDVLKLLDRYGVIADIQIEKSACSYIDRDADSK